MASDTLNTDQVGVDTVVQMKWVHKRFKCKGVVIHDNERVKEKLKDSGYIVELKEHDDIALLDCMDVEDVKNCFEKFKKRLFVLSRVRNFYDLYDFFKPLTDNFKIYHISGTTSLNTVIVAEVWK